MKIIKKKTYESPQTRVTQIEADYVMMTGSGDQTKEIPIVEEDDDGNDLWTDDAY